MKKLVAYFIFLVLVKQVFSETTHVVTKQVPSTTAHPKTTHLSTTGHPLPQSEIILHDNHVFELKNPHRSGSVLKFSLHGPNITGTPEHRFKSIWRIKLSDQTDIYIDREHSKQANNTEYHFHWYGENSTLDREVCFHYAHNNASWYSSYEEKTQSWPMDISKKIPKGKGFVTSDFFSTDFGSIIEQLFVTSDGFSILLNEFDSWFLRRDPNGGDPLLCVAVDHNHFPYRRYYKSDYFHIEFRIMTAKNVRETHQAVMKSPGWIPKPSKTIDSLEFSDIQNILTNPIWSTWAVYHKEINQSTVLEFAQQVKKHGFPVAQIEIDDLWEKHYGDFTFDLAKFPNATKLVEDIHALGFHTTLWVYPFVNSDSAAFNESIPYLTKNHLGQLAGVIWWDGVGGIIDFSTFKAANWFVGRLKKLQAETKIYSFKFDAGEVGWYGNDVNFTDAFVGENPSLITLRYVHACARLGSSIEVRSAYRTQDVPVFVRMLDKNSHWGIDNGLKSLITTALTMSMGGYSFILPDMIGGNAYGRHPSEELYIRWVQANALLPAMQFSIPPWAYSQATVNLTKKFVDLHVSHAATFIALAKRVHLGEPIIRPMWYAAPEDARSFTISDQFMVGEDLMVAPVVEEKQIQRKVFFPPGTWMDQHGKMYSGPSVATVLAPLQELPYFLRKH